MIGLAMVPVFLLSACYTVPQQADETVIDNRNKMTVGQVQRSITEGMSQADVLQVLGAPNLVSRDKSGLETWAYSKHSTTAMTTKNGAYATLVLVGTEGSATATNSTQRTLTVILKFKNGILKEFSYNSTSF